jgi:hypothetical protein
MDTERFDPAELESFATAVVEAVGAPRAHAEQVAESLVRADEVGHGSHGVHRVPWYVQRIGDGEIDPAIAEGAPEDLKAEFLGREITEDERRRREKRGYDLITAHLETTHP